MEEQEEIDTKEMYQKLISFINRLDYKDIAIVLLIGLMYAMYKVHLHDIAACNDFYQAKMIPSSLGFFK